MAKFSEKLAAALGLFNGLLLYSSEQGGGYAVFQDAVMKGCGSHWCQFNVKPCYRKELKFLAHSQSHRQIPKYPQSLESTLVDLGY